MINLIYNGGMVPNLVPCYANAKNNKIIFNRDITYDDIIKLRQLCNSINTDVFTYNLCDN